MAGACYHYPRNKPDDSADEGSKLRIEPEITSVSIVLLGGFNPTIFTPAWFGWQKLLPKEVVDVAELSIAQNQITAFQAEWLALQVVPNRFTISTTQSPFVRLQDMAVKIFREQLPHTPVHSLGINREMHFLVGNYEERDLIGRQLAPTEPWGQWGQELDPDGRAGGMTSLTMTQIGLKDRPPGGQLNVTVEPSTRLEDAERGVYVRVNDHYTVEDQEKKTATSEIIDMLERSFEVSIRRAEQIIDHVMSLKER